MASTKDFAIDLTEQEKQQMLRWFESFSLEQNWVLSSYLDVVRKKAGDNIIKEGAIEDYMGIIVDGSVEISKNKEDGTHKVLAELTPPHSLGEMSMIDSLPRSANAIALTDTTMLILTNEGFKKMVVENSDLAIKLLIKIHKMVNQRLRATTGVFIDSLSKAANT